MATIGDVAERANVSKMTVSRVINEHGYVKEETRKAVLAAIKELDYRPNMLAKGLVTRRTNILAYVVPDISDPFYNLVVKGVQNACYERGYTAIICDAHSDKTLEGYLNMLIDRRIDGVVFHHHNISQTQVNHLAAADVKCVAIDNEQELTGICAIDSANAAGGLMAVRHLVERGHKKIGCVQGAVGNGLPGDTAYPDTFQRKIWTERTRGYEEGMQEAGLSYRRYYPGCGDTRSGYLAAQEVVRRMLDEDDPPTALYCEADVLALGALSEALEKKVPVPEKLAIVGHDGLDMSTMLFPRVTTVVQPRYEMGQIAANLLLDAVDGLDRVECLTLKLSLFQGDTT